MKRLKRVLAFVLSFAMLLGSMTFSFASSVADDVRGTIYESAVETLKVFEIMEGYPDGTFKPEGEITRAEFATIVVRSLGQEGVAKVTTGSSRFNDVAAGEWYTGYINVASSLRVVNGYGDGNFGPNDPVTYEQAVTMVMRAIGYGGKAEDLGGYPTGYLLVANEAGITDDVPGVFGTSAPRGIVAMLVANALDKPMMEVTEWGRDGEPNKYAKNPFKTLITEILDAKKYESDNDYTYAITSIERTGEASDRVRISNVGVRRLAKLAKDADVEYLLGMKVIVYVTDTEVVKIEIDDEAMFDAIEVNEDGDGIKLVEADQEYDLASSYTVRGAGLEADTKYDYAKVILNDDEEVRWIETFNWTDVFMVEKVDGNEVYGYDQDPIDFEDYTVVKDGFAISLDELQEEDVLFFNTDEEYAEVFNKSVTGKIGRIYTDRFEVDSEDYDYYNEDLKMWVDYLDGDELKRMDKDAADDMKESGEPVELLLDRRGNVVFVIGELEESETSSFYAYVTANTEVFQKRTDNYYNLDVKNENGVERSYDIKAADITDEDELDYSSNVSDWVNDIQKGAIVEIEVDASGNVEGVSLIFRSVKGVKFETGDSFVNGKRLVRSAVVFEMDGDDVDEVTTFGELDYDEITVGDVYFNDDDEVIVIVVWESDKDADTSEFDVVAVEDAIELKDGKTWRLKVNVDGTNKTYFTEDEGDIANAKNVVSGQFLTIEVDDDTDEIVKVTPIVDNKYAKGVVETVSIRDRDITVGGTKFFLADAIILDGDETKAVRDISVGDKVEIFRADANSRYVKYVTIVDEYVNVPGEGDDDDDQDDDADWEIRVDASVTVEAGKTKAPTEFGFVGVFKDGVQETNSPPDLRWTSNNTEIATVVDGEITGVAEGNTTVEAAFLVDGAVVATATIAVTVTDTDDDDDDDSQLGEVAVEISHDGYGSLGGNVTGKITRENEEDFSNYILKVVKADDNQVLGEGNASADGSFDVDYSHANWSHLIGVKYLVELSGEVVFGPSDF